MKSDKTKVLLLCCSGRFQTYLANQLNQKFDLIGIVLCDIPANRQNIWARLKHLSMYLNPFLFFKYIDSRINLPKFEVITEQRLQEHFPFFLAQQTFPDKIPVIQVKNINDTVVVKFVQKLKPDVVSVNGTNLLREPLLSMADNIPLGIINLHTGLSPYSRGGNCNLFMLLEDKPQLVGATIHYIDKGIDSGDIIQTLRPKMMPDDPYEYIEAKVFIAGIHAMLEAIQKIMEGKAERVKQWTRGKLFLEKTGYQYSPHIRLQVNRKINKGLIQHYLDNQKECDKGIKLVS